MKLGIVGLASVYWPREFAQAARSIHGVALTAAATAGRSEEQIRISLGRSPSDFATEFALRLYDDPIEMVKQEGLQGAFICAEHSRMVELVEALAPLGVHLYIAKPMANTIERAYRIVHVCESSGIVAASGNTMRFDAGLRAAHQRIENGEIGDPICVRVMHQHGTISGFPAGDWYWDPEEGGPELSLGWYTVDAIRWLSVQEIRRVYAEYDRFATPGSPFMDNGKALMRLSSGALASMDIYFSTKWPFPRWEIEVVGTQGAVKTMQTGYEGMLFSDSGIQAFTHTLNDMVLAEVTEWVEACRSKRQPEVPVADALRTLEACFACRESAETRQPVVVAQRD